MDHSAYPPPALVRRVPVNRTGRDLIVGDVHGCVSKLLAALDAVGFSPAAGDRLFLLGDLVDRGPESLDAVALLSQPWCFAVMGNHEDFALAYRAGRCDVALYAANGGDWFVGLPAAERLPVLDALSALPAAIELETPSGLLGLVHADCPLQSWPEFVASLRAGGDFARVLRDMALWSRVRVDHALTTLVAGVRAVVVGHTPVERPVWLGNVLFLDTAAWFDGGSAPIEFAVFDAATLSPARPLPRSAATPAA